MSKFSAAALLIVDVQKAIDAPYHAVDGSRNNPDAERRIAQLFIAWHREDRPIIRIRHDTSTPSSMESFSLFYNFRTRLKNAYRAIRRV